VEIDDEVGLDSSGGKASVPAAVERDAGRGTGPRRRWRSEVTC
jgi:hypothetical protein